MKKAALHNLGCKVNAYETEAMQQMLEAAGYEIVPFNEPADVYVVNTCSVTNMADRKSRQMLHKAIYQVEPSGGKFIIGSPLFDKATLNVGDGKTFTVRTVNNSDKNIYVQKVTLNGKAYNKTYINFNDMKRGGTLVLTMGAKPSKWGTAKKDRP